MSFQPHRTGSKTIGELTETLLDPVLAKRLGINSALLGAWEEIVGADLAEYTRPIKLRWQRRVSEDDVYRPATLQIACESSHAVFLQHATGEILSRINLFFGYDAVGSIRIEQRPVGGDRRPVPSRKPLDDRDARHLEKIIAAVDDENLREALRKLGTGVIGRK